MAIFESVSRLAGTFIEILQTRLELVAVEVEEESLRFFSYLLFALAAMFCLGVAVLLGVLLIVVIYWDTHRVPVMISMIVFFALCSALIMLVIRRCYRRKPRMLSQTLQELSKDIEQLKPDWQETGL